MTDTEMFTLTDEAFKAYVRDHNKFTLETLKGESLMPDLVVVTRTHELKDELTLCALAVPFNEDKEKRAILLSLGRKFFKEEKAVTAVILSSEAWLSTRRPGSKEPLVQPRDDPNRKENIIVVGSGILGKQGLLISTPIRRDDKNHMLIDGESTENTDIVFPLLSWFWRGYLEALHAGVEQGRKQWKRKP